jgi:hypothetical protein
VIRNNPNKSAQLEPTALATSSDMDDPLIPRNLQRTKSEAAVHA